MLADQERGNHAVVRLSGLLLRRRIFRQQLPHLINFTIAFIIAKEQLIRPVGIEHKFAELGMFDHDRLIRQAFHGRFFGRITPSRYCGTTTG